MEYKYWGCFRGHCKRIIDLPKNASSQIWPKVFKNDVWMGAKCDFKWLYINYAITQKMTHIYWMPC